MEVAFQTETEAWDLIRAAADSREWWLIPWCSEPSGSLSEMIEAAAYVGAESSPDFQVMLLHGSEAGIFALSLAKKRWLSPEGLANLLSSGLGSNVRAEALLEQDVICAQPPDPLEAMAAFVAMVRFNQWLMGKRPAEAEPNGT